MVSILSIDGGGIRGIIPATFLIELEKRTGKPICELFDLIAGTSTGGILAASLTVPDGNGKPRYSAEFIRSAYFEKGGAIFRRSPLRRLTTLNGLTGAHYSLSSLESMLETYLGQARLHDTLTEILVTAYDLTSGTPWFFKTSYARQFRGPGDDPLLSQVALATAAAPTYFPPVQLESHRMVDGGVFACNPALCAYAQARNMFPDETEFLVASLGTGIELHDRPSSKIKNWGVTGWAIPISAVMLNSSSETVNYQMRALVGSENYVRFQVRLEDDSSAMDDASVENMRRLEMAARGAITRQSAAIDKLCLALLRCGGQQNTIAPTGKRLYS